MKRKFITPELKRIEVNLSNDIAKSFVDPATGEFFIALYTWQYDESGSVPTSSCGAYVKGGYTLQDPPNTSVSAATVTSAIGMGYHAWVAKNGLIDHMDLCAQGWGGTAPGETQNMLSASFIDYTTDSIY